MPSWRGVRLAAVLPRVLLLAALLTIASARTSNATVNGRAELQDVWAAEDSRSLAAALGMQRRNDVLADLRLTWEPRWQRWSLSIAEELSFDADDPDLAAREGRLETGSTPPPATWWDLTDRLIDHPHLVAIQHIDRLSVGYTGAHLVLRAGRQALTWGGGLVFHPMDLLDPFAPTAIDTEYKPGTDMLYGQYLFSGGADVEVVAVPRPPQAYGWPSADASSYALQASAAAGRLQTVWMLARDRGDWVVGARMSGALGGATWNLELVPTLVHDGPLLISALANLSEGVTLRGHSTTVFVEYFHSGFGVASRGYSASELPEPLRQRLLRQQIFDTGRDYLAAGVLLQLTPLTQLNPTLIANLNDRSGLLLVESSHWLRENLNILLGAEIPLGPRETEFGGVPLAGNEAPFAEFPTIAYLQLRQYF